MPGIGFISAGFLAAGLAVAAPLLIHLLYRQKARVQAIGSIRFLQQVVREHRRRRRVRQWILLALRCLALLLLALLFARPYLQGGRQGGADEEVAILVDRSASMQARVGRGPSALDRAVEVARRETTRLAPQTAVHLAWFDAGGVEELPLEKFFDRPTAGWLGTDFGLALDWARDVLAAGGRPERRIVLITDLQRAGSARTALTPLDPHVALEIRDVGEPVVHDLAILQAEVARTEIRPRDPIKVRVVVQNGGALPARDVRLDVKLVGPGGPLTATKTVELAGGANAAFDIPLDVRQAGLYRGEVSLPSVDSLAWDDRRYLAFEARPPDRILLVDGQEGRSPFANETYFLETALRLKSDDSAERVGAFEVERIVWDAGKGFPDLAGFRAIVLANVRRLEPTDVERLIPYVRSGGSLILFSGDQTAPETLEALHAAGLLGGRPAAEPQVGPFRVRSWKTDHPALRLFADPQRGDLRRLEFARLLPIEPTPAATTLLSAGERAIAVELAVEKGRTIYFASTADRDWSDWPRSRLYVPLVRQLLAYSTGALGERSTVERRIAERPEEAPGVVETSEKAIVTNVDSREAQLERMTVEELAEAAGSVVRDTEARAAAEQAAILAAPGAERPDELWKALIWLLLAVLTVELLLAGRVHG